MDKYEKQQRTKEFSLRVIKLFQTLEEAGGAALVLGKQLLRCSTSVGANYRAACLAKSTADFVAKLKICEEEADEAIYWLELLVDSGLMKPARLEPLLQEARELSAMMCAAAKTSREKQISVK